MRLSLPDNAAVVAAGVPGPGTSTLNRRVVADSGGLRRQGGRASHVGQYGRIVAAVRGPRPVAIHPRGTVGTLRRAIALVAALHGRPTRPDVLLPPA